MILSYNYNENRYGILNSLDLWEVKGLHCGSKLLVKVEDDWIEDRLEMKNGEYYLVNTGLSGSDLEGLKVKLDDK